MKSLTVEDFARAFGTTVAALPAEVVEMIDANDFAYEPLSAEARDALVREIEARIEAGAFAVAGEGRRGAWEASWSERLTAFEAAGRDLESMIPEYIRELPILRLNRDFVRARDPRFELHYFEVLRQWVFRTFLADAEPVYEFGCGSGYNLVALARSFPEKPLVGLDWSASAVELVEAAAKTHGMRLEGRRFDFFAPDESLRLGSGSAVLTICALEQIGDRHGAFVDYLLREAPARVVHVEPVVDLYDASEVVDRAAILYHEQRGYLSGFLPRLRGLEAEGRLKLCKVQRCRFGSLYHEGYTILAWEPLRCS